MKRACIFDIAVRHEKPRDSRAATPIRDGPSFRSTEAAGRGPRVLIALAAMCVAVSATIAWGGPAPIESAAKTKKTVTSKAPRVFEHFSDERNTSGTMQTNFEFHGPSTSSTTFNKTFFPDWSVSPASAHHSYDSGEEHGTTGSVDHSIRAEYLTVIVGWDGFSPVFREGPGIVDTINGSISPGPDGDKVSIRAKIDDPITFGGSAQNALCPMVPEGLNYSLTISDGTAFPQVWGSPQAFGADPMDCGIVIRGRVSPGVISDGNVFWSGQGEPGSVNLYTVTLTINENFIVNADLAFGSSNANFQLDYLDSMGRPFDPNDAGVVSQLEQSIGGAFNHGMLITPLQDIFSVGFVPSVAAGVDSYTVGGSTSTTFSAFEPIPTTGALSFAGVGVAMLTIRRRR